MPKPTENDWNSFHSMNQSLKARILYEYTCLGYNMQEVVDRNGLEDTRQVSVVTRCYGFDRCRSGMFGYIGSTEDDVTAFLKKYPNGCQFDGKGKTMEEFLKKRVAERKQREAKTQQQNQQQRSQQQRSRQQRSRQQANPVDARQPDYTGNDFMEDADRDETPAYPSLMGGDFYAAGVLIAIVLLFIFRKKIFAFLGFLGGVFKILLLVILAALVIGGIVALIRLYNPFGGVPQFDFYSLRRRFYNPFKYGFQFSSLRLNLQLPNIIICVIMLLIGIGGILKGGSLILGGILCLIGIGALFARR